MQSSLLSKRIRILRKALLLFLFLSLTASFLFAQPTAVPDAGDGWEQLPAILAKIVPPVFKPAEFDLLTYGAAGDGKTDCSAAFRSAIEACHRAGGGRVVVPAGIFLTGAIHLKSNVNLCLSKGAVVRFSHDPTKYLPAVFTRWEGTECYNYSPFIYAFEQTNIAVTGEGTLDGQADTTAWWPWTGNRRMGWKRGNPSQRQDRIALMDMSEKGVPVEQRIFGEGHFLRPNFIQPYRCTNVLIEGVTVVHSPMWEIHPVLCTNVTVRGVTVSSHGPNNDGCDPESCADVLIRNCTFDTGDDCIAIKSGRNVDGRRIHVPSQNIVVQGCTMKDGHGGLVIGSEVSGGVRNVFAENCTMDSPNLDRALRIKTNSVRGGMIENIYMRNITVGQVAEAVVLIDFFYEEGDTGSYVPTVQKLRIQHVKSKGSQYGLFLKGYERSPIDDIFLEDCEFENVKMGNVINNVRDLVMRRVIINGQMQN